MLLILPVRAQKTIDFDVYCAKNVSYLGKKSIVNIKIDPESPSHFYATMSFPNKDTLEYRFFTKQKSIKLQSLERIEKENKIEKDGVCIKKAGSSKWISSFKKGEEKGNSLYRDGVLVLESVKNKGKTIEEKMYYPNGELRALIKLGKPHNRQLRDRAIKVDTYDIVEYYETGEIKREERSIVDGEVLAQKNYTDIGKDTLFQLPFHRGPTFPGGISALYSFVSQNLEYPQYAAMSGIEGSVVLSFIVNRDGKISDIRVVHSLSKDMDEEAIRVLSQASNWLPAVKYGEVVQAQLTLPVKFVLGINERREARKHKNRGDNLLKYFL